MSFTPTPNRGYLCTNDRKTEDTHPDFRGDSAIDKALLMKLIEKGDDPVKIQVSAWNSTSSKGEPYFSLQFSEPFVPQKRPEPTPQQQIEPEDDEDVPF